MLFSDLHKLTVLYNKHSPAFSTLCEEKIKHKVFKKVMHHVSNVTM